MPLCLLFHYKDTNPHYVVEYWIDTIIVPTLHATSNHRGHTDGAPVLTPDCLQQTHSSQSLSFPSKLPKFRRFRPYFPKPRPPPTHAASNEADVELIRAGLRSAFISPKRSLFSVLLLKRFLSLLVLLLAEFCPPPIRSPEPEQ